MMLDTDMCLAVNLRGRTGADAFDRNCCAWQTARALDDVLAQPGASPGHCGETDPRFFNARISDQIERCCGSTTRAVAAERPCDNIRSFTGPAVEHVTEFATNESAWRGAFQAVWRKVTTLGVDSRNLRTCHF